jgi:probable F420-dependent oxidoreductase
VKLGLGLPHYGADATPDKIVEFAQRAESVGYESLWALERLLRPVNPQNPAAGVKSGLSSSYARVFDPIDTLINVAAHTRTIRLGTSVIDALFHVPVILARRLTTLDHFSGGRLIAGLGQGWSADEFEAANVSMRRRGNGFAEFIEALRAAWGDDPVSFQGRFYRIPASEIGPKPLQPGGFQILVGTGPDSDTAAARAGRMGLGLHPIMRDWESLEHQLTVFRAAAPADRQPGPVVVRVNSPVTENPLDDADRGPLSGSVDQVKDDLRRVAELGVDHVMWDLTASGVPYQTQLDLLEPLIATRH